MARFYRRWFGVDLDPEREIQPLIGSKEGILHTTLAFVDAGDQVLVPDPGYPTYTSLSRLLGAEPVPYNLRPERQWQPDFDELEAMDTSRGALAVVQLSAHAHRGTRLSRNLRAIGGLRPSSKPRGGERQPLLFSFSTRANGFRFCP